MDEPDAFLSSQGQKDLLKIFDALKSISRAGPSGTALIARICAWPPVPEFELQLAVTRLSAATVSAKGRAFHKPDIFILEKFSNRQFGGEREDLSTASSVDVRRIAGPRLRPGCFSSRHREMLARAKRFAGD